MSELISIIVLTYNSSQTLCETLDSIKNQTYQEIELIITDDCSKDNTIETAEKWILLNNYNVKSKIIVSDKNTGVAGNCNRGITVARGKYIKLIAGDDFLDKFAIEKFYNALKLGDGKTIFQSRVVIVDENSELIPPTNYVKENYVILNNEKLNQTRRLLKSNFLAAPAMGLINKDIFNTLGNFNEQIPFVEDYPFYLKLSLNGFKFKLLNDELVYYRIHSKSLTGSFSPIYESSMIKIFFKIKLKEQLKHCMFFTAFKQFIYFALKWIRFQLRKKSKA